MKQIARLKPPSSPYMQWNPPENTVKIMMDISKHKDVKSVVVSHEKDGTRLNESIIVRYDDYQDILYPGDYVTPDSYVTHSQVNYTIVDLDNYWLAKWIALKIDLPRKVQYNDHIVYNGFEMEILTWQEFEELYDIIPEDHR